MSINQLDGKNAYQAALQEFQSASKATSTGGDTGVTGAGDGTFASMVGDMLDDVKTATAQAEVTGAKALTGEADLVDVVTAINNAEVVVDTVVRVRDKVMQAYQQISKMPI